MRHALFFAAMLAACVVAEAPAQQSFPIPVYPGATLQIENDSDATCCDFVTTDPFEKVVAFYEKELKKKPMDLDQLSAAYPFVAKNIALMKQHMPPNTMYRGFVMQETGEGAQKMPVTFELIGTPQGVNFSISDDALVGKDALIAREWRQKTGHTTEADREMIETQKTDSANAVEEAKEAQTEAADQKVRAARRAKEEPEYRAAATAELVKFLAEKKVKLPTGLQCETASRVVGDQTSWFELTFTSANDFKTVCDFFAAQSTKHNVEKQDGMSTCTFVFPSYPFDQSFDIIVSEVSKTKGGPKKTNVQVRVGDSKAFGTLWAIEQRYEANW